MKIILIPLMIVPLVFIYGYLILDSLFHLHSWEEIPRPYVPNRPLRRGGTTDYKCKCGAHRQEMWKA